MQRARELVSASKEAERALPGSPRTRERRGHTRQQPAAAARLVKWRPHRRFELKRDNPGGCGMQKTFPEWRAPFPRDFGSRGIHVGPSPYVLFEVSSGVKASTASHPRPSSSRQVRGIVSARAPRRRARAHLSHRWPTQAMRVDSSRDPRVDSFAYNSRQPHNSRPGSVPTRFGSHRGRCVCLALPLPGRV